MLKRETSFEDPYENLDLSAFIGNLRNPRSIQAILSCSAGAGQHPVLVGYVYFSITTGAHLHDTRNVDEGYTATEALRNLTTFVPTDLQASRVWAILHHPLFHTYVHHDASGTGTWTMIASGYKFWVIVVPDGDGLCASRKELHNHNNQFFYNVGTDGRWGFNYSENSKRFCIFGKPGDVMCAILLQSFAVSDTLASFQPPNAWHEVFTPTKSVTVGGHYFTYNTLHLTDAARFFDIHRPGATNQHHTSSQLVLSAMVVNLIRKGPSSEVPFCELLSYFFSYFLRSLQSKTAHISLSNDTAGRSVPFERGNRRRRASKGSRCIHAQIFSKGRAYTFRAEPRACSSLAARRKTSAACRQISF